MTGTDPPAAGGGRAAWPTLPRSTAEALLESVRALPLEAARLASRASHPSMVVPAGQPLVTEVEVTTVQARLRDVVDAAGWPRPPVGAAADAVDRRLGRVLVEDMGLTPVAARDPMLWAFLALVVVPDVALWRRRDADAASLLDLDRHVLGRLWWRETTLGEALHGSDDAAAPTDDELTALFRRRELVANHDVARAIVVALTASGPASDGRSARLRDALRDLLHLTPVVDLDALAPDDLDAVLVPMLARGPVG